MAEGNDKITQIMSKLDMRYFNPGSTHMVHATHINDPKSFYVRLVALDEDMPLVESQGDPISLENIKIGKRVVYKSNIVGKFVRGDIQFISLQLDSAYCTIYAIDYGFKDTLVKLQHIFLPNSEMDCPPLALHCELYFCEPKANEFELDTINAMSFFVGTHPSKMTVIFQTASKFSIELRTVECPDDVATMLGLLHFTNFTHSENAVHRFSQGHWNPRVKYAYKQVTTGDRMCVRVQSGDSIDGFYVAETKDYKRYIKEGFQFTNYCKQMPAQDVQAAIDDELCCGVKVRHSVSDKYERAIVKSITIPYAKALVKLIDIGKEVEVSFNYIKFINSPTYANRPAIAMYCSSTEEQTWDNGLSKFLYEGYTFIIEIQEPGNGIDIPHKVKLIRREGH